MVGVSYVENSVRQEVKSLTLLRKIRKNSTEAVVYTHPETSAGLPFWKPKPSSQAVSSPCLPHISLLLNKTVPYLSMVIAPAYTARDFLVLWLTKHKEVTMSLLKNSSFLSGLNEVLAPFGTFQPTYNKRGVNLVPKIDAERGDGGTMTYKQSVTDEAFVTALQSPAGQKALKEAKDLCDTINVSIIQHLELDNTFEGKHVTPLIWFGQRGAVVHNLKVLEEAFGGLVK